MLKDKLDSTAKCYGRMRISCKVLIVLMVPYEANALTVVFKKDFWFNCIHRKKENKEVHQQ